MGTVSDITCPEPPSIANGSKTGGGTAVESVVHYTCNIGYTKLNGDEVRTCLENGQYTGISPVCGSKCDIVIKKEKVVLNEEAKFSCDVLVTGFNVKHSFCFIINNTFLRGCVGGGVGGGRGLGVGVKQKKNFTFYMKSIAWL